jgi:ATP-dependent Lon protease
LLDRMEVLRLSGYSEEEKFEIARRFIIPRVLNETGVKPEQVVIPDESLRRLIKRYTREAGCRQLERIIARLLRKLAVRFADGSTETVTIDPDHLADLVGREYIIPDRPRPVMPPGVATGLAWTETGGEVLYIEASILRGYRHLRLTGQLGKVMRESAKTAQSYVWAHAQELGIDPNLLSKSGVHIHVPAGAVPKDGPSAGVAMVTALTSLFSGIPVRNDTAMTGEITLAGLVLPIGGVKEKVLAARRNGLKRVILPRDNENDARDLPENVRKEMEFVFAERIDDVLAAALPGLKRAHSEFGQTVS